ncbi:MAG: aspartyl protease family protein [Planctomycetales bacterium]|nr:aspartyl protease family protein [Planctomycetales bacterium]
MEYGDVQQSTFAIYDTGASVVTLSSNDAQIFELLETPLPIKVPGGAGADAIGGPLVGDVSEPVRVLADGLGAVNLVADETGFFDFQIDTTNAASAAGVQLFVGTSQSPSLPTITGTPIHNSGLASRIDMQGFELDLGALFPELPEFEGISLFLPSIQFVESGSPLDAGGETISAPLRVPVQLFGEDNSADPGDLITASYNPVIPGVHLENTVNDVLGAASDQTFLFDTGAQLSVISTEIALSLGLDLDSPETSITVQGAAGTAEIPGYVIDSLEVDHDDNGDGLADGTLKFLDVPVYVLDIVDGIDGIWGMNLLNTAYQFQYDPFDLLGPSVTFSFDTEPFREIELPDPEQLSEEGTAAVDLLAASFPPFAGVLAGPSFPSFEAPLSASEPLLGIGEVVVEPGGVSVEITGPLNEILLNIFDGLDAQLDLPDVTLVGEHVGEVRGSLLWDADSARLEFVKTGDPLEPDNYRFTLFSRLGGFTDIFGRLLDGDGDGIAGGNFIHEFLVDAANRRAFELPDFVRSAGQTVDLAAAGGLPVTLSDGADVTQFQFTMAYDADLLHVAGITVDEAIPVDWQVDIDDSTPGQILVAASGATELTLGPVELIRLDAAVAGDAMFGDAQVLRTFDVQINQGAIPARGDLAVHIVGALGDASGNGDYSGLDASLTARLAVGLDAGLDEYERFDPMLIADVSGDGTISALDAAFIARRAVGLEQPEIPNLVDPVNLVGANTVGPMSAALSAADLTEDDTQSTDTVVAQSASFVATQFEALPPHVQEIFAAAGRAPSSDPPTTGDLAGSFAEHDEIFALIAAGGDLG